MVAKLLAIFLGLTLQMIDRSVDRIFHVLIGFLNRLDVVLLADDQDLADVAVFLHLQHAAVLDYIIEELVDDPAELRVDELSDIWGDFEVATDNSRCHRNPRFIRKFACDPWRKGCSAHRDTWPRSCEQY